MVTRLQFTHTPEISIPTCFFAAADPDRTWQGFDFEEFARIVTEQAAKKAAQTNEED